MKPLRLLQVLLIALLVIRGSLAHAAGTPRSFSLSTEQTFSPGEQLRVQLYARNTPELEFRIYKVRDAEKFFAGLKDLHSFGSESWSPQEQIDQRTFLEWLHDLKADLWWRIRHFFRGQFTDEARDGLREQQGKLGQRSRVVGAAQFAAVPLLNESQLVARWRLITPPTLISQTQILPVDNPGPGIYLIEATDGEFKAYTIAIVTSMVIVERPMGGKAEVFVADRKSGAPVADADLVFWANGHQQSTGKTGSDGLATLTLASSTPGSDPENLWILAQHNNETAIIAPWGYSFASGSSNTTRSYVYTDRPVYRPGHTVYFKGIFREVQNDELHLPTEKTAQVTVRDADNKVIVTRDLPLSAHGTASADFALAADAGLGYYSISFRIDGKPAGEGSFYVEEYKKPEYQVTVKPTVKRILQGNSVQAVIEARYFFGEPVAGAKVKYVVHTSTHYWWEDDEDNSSSSEEGADESSDDSDDTWGATERQEQEGTLDANGRLTVTLPVALDAKHEDEDYRIEARVTDAGNREVSGHATILATYGSFRVHVEPTSYIFSPGQTPRFKITAVDYDGKPVVTPVHLAALLTKWDSDSRTSSESMVAQRDTATGADGAALVDLPLSNSGSFTIKVTANTPEKRTVESRTWVWLTSNGGEFYNQNVQAQIVADKPHYQPGDTAHLLLVSGIQAKPGEKFWAVVTQEGESLQSQRLLQGAATASGASIAFDVPITNRAQPNLIVNAILVHDNQLITAQKSLSVPLSDRRLTITATPSKPQFMPGEKGVFDIFAQDASGKPVEADLSFGAVDEALYEVRPDASGDIISSFYPKRFSYLQPETSFEFYFHGEAGTKSPILARLNGDGLYHPRMAQVKPGSDLVVPKIRKAFPDTAYWTPNVRTGADGHAHVTFDFPDALTTWRATIRGMTDDGRSGSVIARVVVRKNLIVRLAAPRFLRQNDEATLRVIAHNYLATTKEVTFALDITGLDVLNGQQQKITIPARGESYAEWRVRAHTTGTATLTAKALTNEESDALQITLPIRPYGVKQRETGAGILYSGTGQTSWSYHYPPNSDTGTRSLTITVSPSVAGTVFDALDYLTSYPWGCTEQTMSSFLPDVIVAQAADRLHLKSSIDRATLNNMVRAGLDRLAGFQHDDGGWGWWPDDPSRVFMTAYVVRGMGQARDAGYTIENDRMNRGRNWLVATLAAHPNMQPELRSYVVYALATTGGVSKDAIDKLWSTRGKLSNEGLALTGLALDAAKDPRAKDAATELEKKATVTATDVHWESNFDGLLEYWNDSSPEATSFALQLLTRQDRSSGLLAKAALWLAQHRDGNEWETTKQTAMVIMGLTDYLSLSGELANSSDVEVLVNGASIGAHHFDASSTLASSWKVVIPSAQLASDGQVTIRKSGNGITYWSTENSRYSADRKLYQSGNLALNATRDYFLLKKKQDKPDDPITYDLVPFSGAVHVGDIVAVRLAVSGSDWSYMLIEDPIPAGAEFLDHPELYTLNSKPDWWSEWFSRREFHDDRAAFFSTEFEKRHEYVYLLKITTPGHFAISPAQAGPMYQPNVTATTDPVVLEVLP